MSQYSPTAASNNLLAAIVQNNPNAVSYNLAQYGYNYPAYSLNVGQVMQAVLNQFPAEHTPEQGARFMASVLDVQVNTQGPYALELTDLSARNGGATISAIAHGLFFTALSEGNASSQESNTNGSVSESLKNISTNAATTTRAKQLSVALGAAMLIVGSLFTLYVLAKGTKKLLQKII